MLQSKLTAASEEDPSNKKLVASSTTGKDTKQIKGEAEASHTQKRAASSSSSSSSSSEDRSKRNQDKPKKIINKSRQSTVNNQDIEMKLEQAIFEEKGKKARGAPKSSPKRQQAAQQRGAKAAKGEAAEKEATEKTPRQQKSQTKIVVKRNQQVFVVAQPPSVEQLQLSQTPSNKREAGNQKSQREEISPRVKGTKQQMTLPNIQALMRQKSREGEAQSRSNEKQNRTSNNDKSTKQQNEKMRSVSRSSSPQSSKSQASESENQEKSDSKKSIDDDEEMKSERSNEEESSSNENESEESEEEKEQKEPIQLSYKLYEQKIKNDDKLSLNKNIITDKMIDSDNADIKVCKVCFQEVYYPYADQAISEEQLNDPSRKLSDGECLYLMVHCKNCQLNVHWNCIGTDKELIRKVRNKKAYYFFECDKCFFKENLKENPGMYKFNFSSSAASTLLQQSSGKTEQFQCIACESSKGTLKSFNVKVLEIQQEEDDEEKSQELKSTYTFFVHPICAMSFPETFIQVVNQDSIGFTLRDTSLANPLLQSRRERAQAGSKRPRTSDQCIFCKSPHGLFLKSESQRPDSSVQSAHAFCILEQQYIPEQIGNDRYNFCFQVLMEEENDFQPKIHVKSENQKLQTCMCRGTIISSNMLTCDACNNWFHKQCINLDDDNEEIENYKCLKCFEWQDHLNRNLIPMNFKHKSFQQLVNEEQTYWNGIDSLVNYMEDCDIAIQLPVRYFEHFFILKTWHSLTAQILNNVVTEELFTQHIEEAKYIFPPIDTDPLSNALTTKKKMIETIISDGSAELVIMDLQNQSNNSPVTSQISSQNKEQREKHNKEIVHKADELEKKCIEQAKLINESVLNLKHYSQKSQLIQEAYDLLKTQQKPPISEVKDLYERVKALNFHLEDDYSSINTLNSMIKEYEKWFNESMGKFKISTPEEEKVRAKIQKIKTRRIGSKRQDMIYQCFKSFLSNKTTIKDADAIQDKAKDLKVDVSEELSYLDQLINVIKEIEKENEEFSKNSLKCEKALHEATEKLIQACCFPIKSDKIDEFLETWHKSALWTVQAKNFLIDKLTDDQQEELNKMEIDEGNSKVPNAQKENGKKDFIWTLERAQILLKEFQESSSPLFIDTEISKKVKIKVDCIAQLKEAIGSSLLDEMSDIKVLQNFIKTLESMETTDFKLEIHRIQEKIKLIQDVTEQTENRKRFKQNLEILESLENRIQSVADNEQYPINISRSLLQILEQRLMKGREIKKSFYDILATKCQDFFTLNVDRELRAIVSRGEHQDLIDMTKEQRIVDNYDYSKGWFVETYDRLKKCTESLHKIDFTNFIQLSTLLKEEKECVELLKTLKKQPEQLVGAAQNIWRSIFGVKWLFDATRLLKYDLKTQSVAPTQEIELKFIVDLDVRATELLNIDYEEEVRKGTVYSSMFREFSKLVTCIKQFEEKFGNYHKLLKTLEDNIDRLEEFKKECENLTQTLNAHKITSASGELDLLSKIHTYIDFLQRYKQLTLNNNPEEEKKQQADQVPLNKLPYSKAMLIQQLARESQVPEDLSILKRLRESVARFEKFNREYSDYKRYRARLIKSKGLQYSTSTLLDQRFTTHFIQKLIDEQHALQIDADNNQDNDDEAFDKDMLEGDLTRFDSLKKEAETVFASHLEEEEITDDSALRDQFNLVKNQISSQPVYEREIHIKISCIEWMYSVRDMLSCKGGEQLSIGTWEAKIKQADAQIIAVPLAQQPSILRNLRNHSLYQRVLWEVDQAKQCIEFVASHRLSMKGLAGRYLQDSLKQAFNISYAFRNKPSKAKVEKIFQAAKQSKIDLSDEIRHLNTWILDYEQFTQAYSAGTLLTENSYERLKEIAKVIYVSPIDMCDLYLKLKPRLDMAEAIKLDLKRIIAEHEGFNLLVHKKVQQPQRKLRYSRISDSLQIFQKQCKIQGIKEIDGLFAKVQKSRDLLNQASALIKTVNQETQDVQTIIDKCKDLLASLELDFDKKELEVRRLVFETELRYILFNPSALKRRKIDINEFKATYEKDYDTVKVLLQDQELQDKFEALKKQVHECLKKINRVQTKEQLQEVEREIAAECAHIDFSLVIADMEACITLGKRPSLVLSQSDHGEPEKRQKLTDGAKKVRPTREASSSSSSSEGSSSSGGSSSSSSSSGGDQSSSEQESSSSSEESKTNRGLASGRPRRKINPNLDSNYIYSKSTVKAHEKAKQSQSSSDSEVEREEKKISKRQKLKEKKKQLGKQLEEHRKQKKMQEQVIFQKEQNAKREKYLPEGAVQEEATINPVSMLKQDPDLQKKLQDYKLKIRQQSKKKIKDSFLLPGTVFSTINPEEIESIAVDFEDEISKKHPEVDHYYRRRITDICSNISLLKDYKDISNLIAIKKALSYGKLLQNQHAFKEDVLKYDQQIKERRAQLKNKTNTSLRVESAPPLAPSVSQQSIPAPNQQLEEAKSDVDPQSLVQIKVQPSDDLAPTSQSHISIDENDDLESCESNPALFSDNEDTKPMNAVQSILKQVKSQEIAQRKQRYKSQQPILEAQRPMTPVQQSQVPENFTLQGVRLQYNPYEIFEAKHLGGSFMRSSYQQPLRKPSEPILYDPSKSQQKSHSKQLNTAAPGSLLKVWDGGLELAKDHQVKCELYSLQDIALYQQLPEIPQNLTLKGKAKLGDVTTHFLRLKRDKRLLKGWLTRRGVVHQENNDRYCRLFEELEATDKSALFNMYQNTTLYLVPVTPKNKEFIVQMGIDFEKVKDAALYDESKQPSEEAKVRIEEEIKQLKEETHLYAYFCQIKQTFTHKTNFLNPDVLMHAHPPPVRPQRVGIPFKQQQDANFSPITSDEEGKPSKKSQSFSVKQEEQQHGYIAPQQPQQQNTQFLNRPAVPQDPRLAMRQMQQPPFYPSADPRLTAQQRYPTSFAVKQQDEDMGGNSYSNQMSMHNIGQQQQQEEDDDVDIDDLIEGFKKNEYNLQSIQAKLMTVIHKVKGEKEVKLTQFLQELIFNLKNSTGGGPQASQQQQPMIKSEDIPHQQPDQNVQLGYSYPAGIGSSMIQQQSMGGFRPPSSYPGILNTRYQQPGQQPFIPQQQHFLQQPQFGQPSQQPQFGQPGQQPFLRPPPTQFYPGANPMYGQQGPSFMGGTDMLVGGGGGVPPNGNQMIIRPPPGAPQVYGQQQPLRPPPTQQQMNYYQQHQNNQR